MVFGKRDTKPEGTAQEDVVVGNLYPDTVTSEVDVAPPPSEFRREERGNESVIDPHARFNGKYSSDRDLRIEGEAQGEIECQGTLIISPQARVRSAIKAHNVVINGDYEGNVDCGGRFEIGSTGRVKGEVKTQVLVIKEGAYLEGAVTMSRDGAAPTRGEGPTVQPVQRSGQPASGGVAGALFNRQERPQPAPAGERGGAGQSR
jgi:cytoskeletal protein CcmA (bactofilin family)